MKHFVKTVVVFTFMIILGLAGIIALSMLDRENKGDKYSNSILGNLGLCKISDSC